MRFLHDFLRENPTERSKASSRWARIAQKKLRAILESGGIRPLVMEPYFQSNDEAVLREFLEEASNKEVSWASFYESRDETDLLLAESISRVIGSPQEIVLGYELAPSIVRALEALNVQYIDLRISPIRFGEDYPVRVLTNAIPHNRLESLQDSVQKKVLLQKDQWIHAFSGSLTWPSISEPPGVFFLQTANDSSLIDNGMMAGAGEASIAIQLAAMGHDHFWIKAHPFAKIPTEIMKLVKENPRLHITEDHPYLILSQGGSGLIAHSLSSGMLEEASLFGIESRRWLHSKASKGFDLWSHQLGEVFSTVLDSNDTEPCSLSPLRERLGTQWSTNLLTG